MTQQAAGTHTVVDLGQMANGAYSMRITSFDGKQINRKFIINK